jgi:preprotein translocase subunit SecG
LSSSRKEISLITVITIIHLVACVFLILVVLLQTGKGAEMGAVFGGGGSSTLFGASGAGNFLTKLTTGTAIVFFLTSLTLAYNSISRTRGTVFDRALPAPPPLNAPAENQAPTDGGPVAENPAPQAAAPAEPAPPPAAPVQGDSGPAPK